MLKAHFGHGKQASDGVSRFPDHIMSQEFSLASSSSPSSKAVASSLNPAAGLEDDEFSLDFTAPNAISTAAPEPLKEQKPRLTLELEPLAARAPEAPAAMASMSSAPLSVLVVPVPVFPLVRLDPLLEQVARVFAAGKAMEARKLLESAVQAGGTDEAGEAAWWLLFDVYRALAAQEAFDKLAIEFAQRFEKSPPAWNLQPVVATAQPGTADAGRASVALTGKLNARCAPQFGKLVAVAGTRSMLRLDLSKLQEADNGGCQLLLDTIQALKKTDCELVFGDAEHLADMLQAKVSMGQRENEAVWLLLLELYQWLGLVDSFEEQAVGYAVTFEVSPPSMVPKRKAAVAMPAHEFSEISVEEETVAVLTLEGELLQATATRFAEMAQALAEVAAEDEIVVDFTRLQRIDESSAMALQQALSEVPHEARNVRLAGCNHLVATLLEMAGVGALARV